MSVPFFPPTEPRTLPQLMWNEEGFYLAAEPKDIDTAARYALALQEALDDAEAVLEPLLPPEVRPYVATFERYLLARAEERMAEWAAGDQPPR